MKILHLTDFHYDDKNTAEQNLLVEQLIGTLTKMQKPDFLFFTGDLVLKGGKNGVNFVPAHVDFLSRVSKEIGIEEGDVFICCGNHDVNRNKEIVAIKEYIDRISSNDQLNTFAAGANDAQFKLSLANIEGYLKYQEHFYSTQGYENDNIEKLYSIHSVK